MEKKVILCDVCEVQICDLVCPLCNKDCCKSCFEITNISLGDNLISNLEICTNCYYTCKIIKFDKDSIGQLIKDLMNNIKDIIATAHLADDNLDSKIKKMKRDNEDKPIHHPYDFQIPTGLTTTSNYYPTPTKRRGLFRNSSKGGITL